MSQNCPQELVDNGCLMWVQEPGYNFGRRHICRHHCIFAQPYSTSNASKHNLAYSCRSTTALIPSAQVPGSPRRWQACLSHPRPTHVHLVRERLALHRVNDAILQPGNWHGEHAAAVHPVGGSW